MNIVSPWRNDFPVLKTEVNSKPLVYLDSAATAQKPQCVIDRITEFYQNEYASVHRGIHHLSALATEHMEKVRADVAHFIGAGSTKNIIFTKGTTESINLIANTFPDIDCRPGDEIIVTEMEHHANIVPWQLAAKRYQLTVKVWPLDNNGTLSIADLEPMVSKKTKLIAFTHISNVLGTVNPVKTICDFARLRGIATLLDGAQAVMHDDTDVNAIGCDFYTFSGHKMYGPTGIGILYISDHWLEALPPWEGGGAMIESVSIEHGTTYQDAPWRFEAGTPNIAGILGLGKAIDYLSEIGIRCIREHEHQLLIYMLEQMKNVPSLAIYTAPPEQHSGIVSFNIGTLHAFDVGSFLDRYGVAIRTGHHCAMPLLKKYGLHSVCRASLGLYSDSSDVDTLVERLIRIETLLN